MPLISIVVPVYGVEAYLRPCLDSILAQSFADFEVVAIDDSSPDRSGEIIDEYSARDRRVRSVHLSRNVGLGRARNVGLALARGTYTWFVDSDDWIAAGALAAIGERVESTKPDVLMVDYARSFLNGSTKRNVLGQLLAQAPETFHIDDYPELLRTFGVAWNKVVRTEFLREAEIPFPFGWYEDIPFTFPLLAKANRISTLDRVCLLYRQRRHGNILGSASARHGELLDQYELALARLDAASHSSNSTGVAAIAGVRTATPVELRREVVKAYLRETAVGHGLLVLNAEGRLPWPERPAFFQRLVEFARRHGLRPHGIKQRLQMSGAWKWYPQAKKVWKTRPRKDQVTRKLRRLPGLVHYWWQRRQPLEDLAVYSSYWGRAYECNPAAIHAKAKELAPHVRGVWAVTPEHVVRMPQDVEHVVVGSFGYYRAMARAKWAIYNDNLEGEIVKRPGSIHVQTHHGTPLKHMGVDEPGVDVQKLLKRCDRWDFSLSANHYSSEIWARAYPARFETLEYGYPRNDVLVHAPAAPGTGMVLYAPTFRPGAQPPVLLGVNVIVKHHYFDEAHPQPRIERLMLAADVLITDYSSVMFDFALLDRPIVIYAPDWESYVRERGVYFDLMREAPGPVATTLAELQEIFDSGAVWGFAAERAAFRERFCQFDDGKAAERLVRKVFLS
ncbi:MAG TPA: hypothetical protein DGT23_07820 [Micromonosporaceae bacterium]|nr:hypothetical protein [Micromonosporaceae bacterium]